MALPKPPTVDPVEIAIAIAFLAPLVGAGIQILGRIIVNYRLTEHALHVTLLFLVPVLIVPYTEIVEAKVVPWRQTLVTFPAWRLGNRVYGDGILIRRKNAILPILISPSQPARFAEDLRTRLKSSD